jgi:hypothetical protein
MLSDSESERFAYPQVLVKVTATSAARYFSDIVAVILAIDSLAW